MIGIHQAIRAAAPARLASARAFSTSMAARKDLIQDLYVQKLREYKPPAKAADAHVGTVRSFQAPSSPQPPQLPSDLASELSKFDSAEVHLTSAAPAAEVKATTDDSAEGQTAEEYLAFLEKDLPKADAHH